MLCLGGSIRGKEDESEQRDKIERDITAHRLTQLGCQREQGMTNLPLPTGSVCALQAMANSQRFQVTTTAGRTESPPGRSSPVTNLQGAAELVLTLKAPVSLQMSVPLTQQLQCYCTARLLSNTWPETNKQNKGKLSLN